MDTRGIEVLIGETIAAASAVAIVIEGLEDDRSTDLVAFTQNEVSGLLADYERRRVFLGELMSWLRQTKAAIESLTSDGHPKLPTRGVLMSALADLDQNIASQIAAREKFYPLTTQGELSATEEGPIS